MKAKTPSLTKRELQKLAKKYIRWHFSADFQKATLTLSFSRHIEAVVFIARLSIHAEVLEHHPEMHVTRAKIKLILSSKPGLSKTDFALIDRIEKLCAERG